MMQVGPIFPKKHFKSPLSLAPPPLFSHQDAKIHTKESRYLPTMKVCVCVCVFFFFALKFSCYFRPGMYATPLLQHEYNNGRRRKKKKYKRTYIRHDKLAVL